MSFTNPFVQNPLETSREVVQLWTAMCETAVYSGVTIASRVWLVNSAMLSGQALPWVEMSRMVTEKHTAAMTAMTVMATTAPGLAGAAAMLDPYHQATRKNAARLSRRA